MSTPISLEHRSILKPLWNALCLEHHIHFCEYSFSNAFLFQNNHSYLFVDGEMPYVSGKFEDGSPFFIPTLPPEHPLVHKTLQTDHKALFPSPDSWLPLFDSPSYRVTSNRNESDYLFTRNKLASLAGRHLSSRRNLLHQLEEHYILSSKPLDESNVTDALRLLDQWQEMSGLLKEKSDYYSCKKGLELLSQLELQGRIIYADGIAIGFALYDLLTPKTALLISVKTLKDFKGATPFLYREVAEHLPDSVEWINLEQDLGIEALRHAKMAYAPDLIAPKWRIVLGSN